MTRKRIAWGDILSTLNIMLGGIALMYVLDNSPGALAIASILVFIIMFIDGLDGPLARNTRPTRYGTFLDSISDGIGFVLVPSLLVYSAYYTKGVSSIYNTQNAVLVGLLSMYIAVGFRRLAQFATGKRKTPYFLGAPVSLSTVIILASYGLGAQGWVVAIGLLASIILISSPARYPKMRDILMVGGGTAVAVGIVSFYLLFHGQTILATPFLQLLLVLCVAYIFSPLWWKRA